MTTATKPLYQLNDLNPTALIPEDFLRRFNDATAAAGVNTTQAIVISLTLLYADPAAWRPFDMKGPRPNQANFHVRIPGIVGTWVENMRETIDAKRTASGDTSKTTKTEILGLAMAYFIDLTESGTLMSTMGRTLS